MVHFSPPAANYSFGASFLLGITQLSTALVSASPSIGLHQLSTHHINRYHCKANIFNIQNSMIKTFRHKGLQLFFETGKKSGIQAAHANTLDWQ